MKVVCTTGILAELATAIGGEHVSVQTLIPHGADPHAYLATDSDREALRGAEVVFSHGLQLEAGLAPELAEARQAGRLVESARDLDADSLLATGRYGGQFDPHVWMDVELWRKVADTVRNGLLERDPAQDGYFATNYANYYMELIQLDSRLLDMGSALSAEQRVLVTATHGCSYFARANRFELLDLQDLAASGQLDDAALTGLADYIVAHHVPAIFVQDSLPKERLAALQAACASRGCPVEIGGVLHCDSLPGELSYMDMREQDMRTIVTGLGADLSLLDQVWQEEAEL